MKCPNCTSLKTGVTNTRPSKKSAVIWRRRRCLTCKKLFTSHEIISLDFLIIKKRSGKTTRYVRDKLFASIYDALAGAKGADRGDAVLAAQKATEQIEARILAEKRSIVPTHEIVNMVTDELEKVNLGACYRYAAFSPYRGMRFGI